MTDRRQKPFWSWALEAYARPDVPPACLDLQDRHRQSIPYLLWAAWAARSGRLLVPTPLDAGAQLALAWEQSTVAPLRLARRGLASGFPGVPDAERDDLRQEVKAVELRAEALVMRALEQMTPPGSGAPRPLEPALAAAVAAWPFAAPPDALRRLVLALG
jgi:uncharacterized protein (TIGR02444 family)